MIGVDRTLLHSTRWIRKWARVWHTASSGSSSRRTSIVVGTLALDATLTAPVSAGPHSRNSQRMSEMPNAQQETPKRSKNCQWLASAGVRMREARVQEPRASLRLVDPDLDQARRRDVAGLVTDRVRFAHVRGERRVVFAELCEHVGRLDVIGVVIKDTLVLRDLPDRLQCRRADLANALRDRVGHREDLIGLLVEQQ